MVASATIPNSDIVLRRSGHGDNAVVFVHGPNLQSPADVWMVERCAPVIASNVSQSAM